MNVHPDDHRIDRQEEQARGAVTRGSVTGPRLYLAFVVLVSAEMFSGSSAGPKLFTWWTWCVTFWVYFLHFFLFANLAVRTRRTSLRALYLWGVLYGLYEGPLTKVIWAGFGSQGEFALAGDGFSGQLLGHGLMEMSMALLWHPFASFLLPLCLATLLMPELRALFPDLGRFLSGSRRARLVRGYIAATFALTLPAVLSFAYSHTLTLAYVLVTWAIVLGVLVLCYRCFAQRMRQAGMGRRVLVLQRRGLCPDVGPVRADVWAVLLRHLPRGTAARHGPVAHTRPLPAHWPGDLAHTGGRGRGPGNCSGYAPLRVASAALGIYQRGGRINRAGVASVHSVSGASDTGHLHRERCRMDVTRPHPVRVGSPPAEIARVPVSLCRRPLRPSSGLVSWRSNSAGMLGSRLAPRPIPDMLGRFCGLPPVRDSGARSRGSQRKGMARETVAATSTSLDRDRRLQVGGAHHSWYTTRPSVINTSRVAAAPALRRQEDSDV